MSESVSVCKTHRVVGALRVHTATVFKRYTLIVTKDKARVTFTAFNTLLFTARLATHTHTCLWT